MLCGIISVRDQIADLIVDLIVDLNAPYHVYLLYPDLLISLLGS